MRQSIVLLALLLPPISATAEQFDLVCTYSVATAPQQPQETIQHIDTDRNTVNGYPAKITEAEIKYEGTLKEDQSRTMTLAINRYTGTFQTSFSGPPDPKYPAARGTCTKPAKQKF